MLTKDVQPSGIFCDRSWNTFNGCVYNLPGEFCLVTQMKTRYWQFIFLWYPFVPLNPPFCYRKSLHCRLKMLTKDVQPSGIFDDRSWNAFNGSLAGQKFTLIFWFGRIGQSADGSIAFTNYGGRHKVVDLKIKKMTQQVSSVTNRFLWDQSWPFYKKSSRNLDSVSLGSYDKDMHYQNSIPKPLRKLKVDVAVRSAWPEDKWKPDVTLGGVGEKHLYSTIFTVSRLCT